MRLINIEAFLERERAISEGRRPDRRTKVLEFCNDETKKYAILSHRWIDPTEVDYEEMAGLAKMDEGERDEIRQRLGYKKVWDTCQQAKMDGYEWVWVDTCCIDKRSSAELSEAINSMYRWYEHSGLCYAYLHDVPDSSFPTQSDESRYPSSNGWPEWFSRGWTLQEMIAPRNLRFFNMNWHPIGDKAWLAEMLERITRVPQRILTRGLAGNRPCVAQIMSWAGNRTTTRVEDRAYSLMGLLDVNMPMLYGEGRKAFHRLQLEIIHTSNDQSIFAWHRKVEWTGSALADDPIFFERCSQMELMDHEHFLESLKKCYPNEELPLIEEDNFGTFPITNRGIHIWMVLDRYHNSDSVFQGILPCRFHPQGQPVIINLALWNSNYYRCTLGGSHLPTRRNLQFRQVYLRYQDAFPGATFEVDDREVVDNGFTCCDMYPRGLEGTIGGTVTLTNTNPLSARVYSNGQHDCRFAVAFGQCFSQGWLHVISWLGTLSQFYDQESVKGPERARCMTEMPSRDGRHGRIWVNHIRLPGWIVRISRLVWERSKIGIRIETFRDSGINIGLNEWRTWDVQGTSDSTRDIRGLMLRDTPCRHYRTLHVDEVLVEFSLGHEGTNLGDYGYFTDSGNFWCKGNVFADIRSLTSEADTIPRQHRVTDSRRLPLVVPPKSARSLPRNRAFNSSLAFLSSRLTNAYLVTMIVQCVPEASRFDINSPSVTETLCTIAKPFVWHQER